MKKKYRVFKSARGEYEAVKIGWSWPAFLFTWVWALINGMWRIGLGVLVASVGVSMLFFAFSSSALDTVSASPVGFSIAVIFGINGNEWRENKMFGTGYRSRKIVTAKSADEAVATYLRGQQ
ncbi:DUF2628 domain-containing protein [Arhodomonas aquaeolei]|uniref:DUF2628 domain-containing protein n=1 Tax=Arhodomonas aquaeolei TaxID=2369 RepID=UPI002168176C|nr:DUF2628 domain-containing protein [Arhodomonas aquaeolei]MCS4505867.1 DUF2628 domain-containing protein [Arhodomonas aquaeolei]